jgi:xanthine dehydrogenase molybdopterin-binding subunit B
VRTYVGSVAEVEVNRSTGDIKVIKFSMAHDCGQIINPDGLKNQLDGNVLQTLSRTLKEELTFDRSHVTSLDWKSYRILRFPDQDLPDVVYIEQLTSALYLDKRDDVDHYAAAIETLCVEAEPPDRTIAALTAILHNLDVAPR